MVKRLKSGLPQIIKVKKTKKTQRGGTTDKHTRKRSSSFEEKKITILYVFLAI